MKNNFAYLLEFLKAVKKNKIDAFTSTIVLTEIVWTLNSYYQFKKNETIKAYKSIINLRGLEICDQYDC